MFLCNKITCTGCTSPRNTWVSGAHNFLCLHLTLNVSNVWFVPDENIILIINRVRLLGQSGMIGTMRDGGTLRKYVFETK